VILQRSMRASVPWLGAFFISARSLASALRRCK
jgi:hypothetical protein